MDVKLNVFYFRGCHSSHECTLQRVIMMPQVDFSGASFQKFKKSMTLSDGTIITSTSSLSCVMLPT